MKKQEQLLRPEQADQPETEQEKRARLISRYIKNKVIGQHESADEKDEEAIRKTYANKTPKEKADMLYQKMMVYLQEMKRRRENKQENEAGVSAINPKLISRIKILFSDPAVRELLPATYGAARVDQQTFRASEIARNWRGLETSLSTKKVELSGLERDLFQEKIKKGDNSEEMQTRIVELGEEIEEEAQTQKDMATLVGYEKTQENTDAAALISYEVLNKYREQLDGGFVWLPSREDIDLRAMKVINSGNLKQTRKGVFFISEPGSGKSEQIRAIAKRLTGMDRVKISCGPKMGESQLLGKGRVFPGAAEIEKGTFTEFKDTVSAAWTGYDYSYEDGPTRNNTRVIELDEMPKAFENETAFSILKNLFSLKDGDIMPGTDKPVLPGRVLLGSGNLGQHHGTKTFPKALEREFVVIPVDYIEMTMENPEMFEFMVAALMEKGGIQGATKGELQPAYKKRDLSKGERKILSDKSVVIAMDEMINDPTSIEHGFLYRLAYAVKAIQNSYMAGGGENAYIDYTKREILRYKDNDDGTVSVAETSNQIILGTTITLNDIAGWMIGYCAEVKKKKSLTFSEWMQIRIRDKIDEKYEDREKLRAIFDNFHLFDKILVDRESKPLTPKEIGYLSPRVPRPVYVEKPAVKTLETVKIPMAPKEVKEYKTTRVVLESGARILIRVREFTLENGVFDLETKTLAPLVIEEGRKIRINGQDFSFAGVVEDKNSKYDGQPVGQLEELYRALNVKELGKGIFSYEAEELMRDVDEEISEQMKNYWETECVDNPENNPNKMSCSV